MATYVYETIPTHPDEEPVCFEVRQSMNDAPLKTHPQTGQPVRRVITGGYGIIKGGRSGNARNLPEPGSCGTGCCCRM